MSLAALAAAAGALAIGAPTASAKHDEGGKTTFSQSRSVEIVPFALTVPLIACVSDDQAGTRQCVGGQTVSTFQGGVLTVVAKGHREENTEPFKTQACGTPLAAGVPGGQEITFRPSAGGWFLLETSFTPTGGAKIPGPGAHEVFGPSRTFSARLCSED